VRIGFGILTALSALVVAALIGVLVFTEPGRPTVQGIPPATLTVYCAAGLQPPVSEILAAYEASHPVQFQTKFGGSGSLLSEIRVAGGDLFLAADRIYLAEAEKMKLVSEIVPIAYQFPVIVVRKGNPRRISGLDDLLKTDVRLSLADPERAAIGKVVRGLLEKDGRWAALWKKAVIQRDTVNQVGNDVKLSAADAGIVWNATAVQYPDLEMVRVAAFDRSKNEIAVGLLSSSKNPAAAKEFLGYLVDPAQGLRVFARHGYEVATAKPSTSP
jgi:molybdate transport system substrate-binding protein